jgi:hypothetical protein
MPNQAKKQRKKAIHVMWNARICGVDKENSAMRVALAVVSMADAVLGEIGLQQGPPATARQKSTVFRTLCNHRAPRISRGDFFGNPKPHHRNQAPSQVWSAESARRAAQSLGTGARMRFGNPKHVSTHLPSIQALNALDVVTSSIGTPFS